MKLSPEARHLQFNLSLLNQPPTKLPESQDRELALALMELLLRAAAGEEPTVVEPSGGHDESEAHK
jgi:hypothetical protein